MMELAIIALISEEEEEERNKKKEKRNRVMWVHDLWKKRRLVGEFQTFCTNLHSYPDIYYDYYKMNYDKFKKLVNILEPHLRKQETNYRMPISVEERLSICLRFLTTGISCKALAHSYRVGYSTVNTIVNETCAAIWKHLQPLVMPKPTPELWAKIEEEFKTKWNFPNCIGAIDGKHVNIRAPYKSGSLYFNYKKIFSVVLLAVADANYKFVVVDIGAYGRNSDSGILSGSKLGQLLQNDSLGIPSNKCLPGNTEKMPHVFVADEAFPLSKHMMRPYPGSQVTGDEEKKIFNYRLSHARRIVESTFGILSQKFEAFQKKIRMQPKYLDLMILACTCLHNFIRTHDNEVEEDIHIQNEVEVTPPGNSILQNIHVQQVENNEMEDGMAIRDKFKSYFNSQNGAVPWQTDMIRRVGVFPEVPLGVERSG